MAHRGRAARRRRSARRASTKQQQLSSGTGLIEALERRREAREGDAFAVSGATGLPLSDREAAWDAGAAAKSLDPADLPKAFFWVDPKGDAKTKSAYKLGFASKESGTLTAIWRGVTAAAGAIQGARGGVQIPAADAAAVKGRIAGYYKAAATKFKDDAIKPPWVASNEASIAFAEERGIQTELRPADAAQFEGEIDVVMGGFDPNELDAIQVRAMAESLAYAELGPDAEPQLLEMATALYADEFAPKPACAGCDHAYTDHLGTTGPCEMDGCDCTSYSAEAEAAVVAAVGDVAWAPEDGFVDLLCDVNEILAENGTSYDYDDGPGYACAVDVAIKLDKVLIRAGDDRFVAPITVGADNEPTLSDPSEWVPVEKGMIEVAPESALNPGLGRLVLTEFAVSAPDAPVAATLPDAHKPGARMPRRNPTAKEPAAPESATPTGPTVWNAVFAPEGRLTSDRRAFAPGSITWREPPLTLMGMIETSEGGHVGAEVSGRIDDVWRDDKASLIRGKGVFQTDEYGEKIAGYVGDETLRGISVDLAISSYTSGPRAAWFDDDGNWIATRDENGEWQPASVGLVADDVLDLYQEDTIHVVLAAEIGMVTVCPFPAFAEAKIAVGDSLVAGANLAFWTVSQQAGWTVEECETCAETIVADAGEGETAVTSEAVEVSEVALTAAAAGLVPETPPAEWFADPSLEEPTAITVDDDGRIYGHAATWGVCHIGFPSACRTAPHSKTDYSYFHLGEIVCADGARLPCGQITLDAPHADLRLDRAGATSHYDHTGTVVAHVRCGEDEHGIWVAGALQPDAPAEKVRLLRGSKLSGDWRDGELVALLAVNVPGFPVPRQRALAASGEEGVQVLSLVAAGIPVFEAELSEEERERFAELAELAKAG